MFSFCDSKKKVTGDVRFTHLTCSHSRQKGVRNWYSKYKPEYKEHTHMHSVDTEKAKLRANVTCKQYTPPRENVYNGEWHFRVYANFSTNTIISHERI